MNKLVMVGGGGHSRSVLDSLLATKAYEHIVVVDRQEKVGQTLLSCPIVGTDEDLPGLFEQGYSKAFVALGDHKLRAQISEKLIRMNFQLPNIVDPSAIVSPYAEVGEGVYIGKRAVVNANVRIEEGAIINTSSVLEHDCQVGAYSHVAPGTVLCGGVKIGSLSHIGAGSVIREQLEIGDKVMIGMGSVVTTSFPSHSFAYGHPCKERKKE
ncbi:acetyltransferase [Jeotgalibacillus aurantiacus]|uniref:acetyltransferase n=1 Tax=Jeotgalibacillus aurantiacus TaxID=2763266 RepID=UPI001D0A639A|nr:acetyltransferase [Jeotgalibacillus aurantiacus]